MSNWILLRKIFFILTFAAASLTLHAQSIMWERAGVISDNIMTIAFGANGNIYAGGLGAYRSSDNGNTWDKINKNLIYNNNTVNVESIVTKSDGKIFAGTRGAGVFISTNNGDDWTAISNGLTDSYVVRLAANSQGHVYAGTLYSGVFRTTDNGANWEHLTVDSIVSGINSITFKSDGTIFAAGSKGVFRSNDNGKTWILKNKGFLETKPNIYSLLYADNGKLYAGSFYGIIYVSTNDGESWKVDFQTSTSFNTIYAFAKRSNGDIFCATGNNGMFMLKSGATTWVQINDGLETLKGLYIAVGPDETVFSGTEIKGVYRGNQALITVNFSGAFCNGNEINIPFTTLIDFNENNEFTAQLSNPTGAFTNPITLGSIKGTKSGVITAKLNNVNPGLGYRIRIIASNPKNTSTNNGSDIAIYNQPTPNIKGPESGCENTILKYASDTTQNHFPGIQYQWEVTGGTIVGPANAVEVQVLWGNIGKGTLKLTENYPVVDCSGSIQLPMDILSIPAKPVITREGNTMISNYENGNQWYLNGEKIPAANQKTYHTNDNGKYTVQITGDNGCPSPMSDEFDFVAGILDNPETNGDFSVFPNPTTGILNLKIDAIITGNAVVLINNMVGETLIRENIQSDGGNQKTTLDLSRLADGMYIIQIQQRDRIETRTVLKVK